MLKQWRPAFVSALVICVSLSLVAQDPYGLELFTPTDQMVEKRADTDLGVVRSRAVEINTSLFAKNHAFHGDRTAPGSALELNLFEDVYFTGILEQMTDNADGSRSWTGYLAEYEHSSVVITIMPDGVVTGNVVYPDGFYQIRYRGNGVHAVRQVDQSSFPPDAEPIEVEPIKGQIAQAGFTRDSGSVVDVMVVWTPSARSAAGGTSAIQSLINTAVAETNQSYSNSSVNFTINLVHSYEVSYSESGNFSTDLSRLRSKTDGYMDNVHTNRDTYCADHVVLIVNSTQYCGIAYLMSSVSTSFESSAFSVVARTCATGYYSFGHELGHNMGARHDWYVDSSTSPYVYNHGYVNGPDRWRTVMAYNSQCSASGYNCTRIQYWSNPSVTYGGDPMGVGGTSVGSSANNALALNNSASTVANFRDSASQDCGGDTGGGGNTCTGDEYTGSLTGTGDYAYEPNGTYYYSSSSGSHTAELTGPGSADFDLYLWKWNGSGWSTVASGTTSSSNETVSYSGSAGYYVWRVYSYSGSGDYELCTTRP